jgi:hypothetical protein
MLHAPARSLPDAALREKTRPAIHRRTATRALSDDLLGTVQLALLRHARLPGPLSERRPSFCSAGEVTAGSGCEPA